MCCATTPRPSGPPCPHRPPRPLPGPAQPLRLSPSPCLSLAPPALCHPLFVSLSLQIPPKLDLPSPRGWTARLVGEHPYPHSLNMSKKDPCQKQACEIQKCLQANNYLESKCETVLQEMRKCCARYSQGRSVCCSGFEREERERQKFKVTSEGIPPPPQ
ncbi:cx9C motif-containing protein 4 isoform X2 [Manacus candei]|uniref:cx9C motif-containing protein 4 isoform X2 n=1 Tax=Manacus candei TaxID=415023 RepID=UPI002226DD0B|nr:cx9C motif-containing protein 4 isoform X2 [Manacus candei]